MLYLTIHPDYVSGPWGHIEWVDDPAVEPLLVAENGRAARLIAANSEPPVDGRPLSDSFDEICVVNLTRIFEQARKAGWSITVVNPQGESVG